MGYAAPQANAVNFDFTEPGYSAPLGNAVDFDFSAAIVLEIPAETFGLLDVRPLFLPVMVQVERLQFARLHPTYSGPGMAVSIPAQLFAAQGLHPALQANLAIAGGVLSLVDLPPSRGLGVSLSSDLLVLSSSLPTLSTGLAIPSSGLTLLERGPSYPVWWDVPVGYLRTLQLQPHYFWRVHDLSVAQIIYTFTLTGSPDVVIPVSSIQMRRRDGEPTYINVVIPHKDYAAIVAARSSGEMVIKKGYRFADGSTSLQEIARADLDQIRVDRGGRNASISLIGYKTVENTVPKTVELSGASYRAYAGAKRRYRCAVDLWLQPGDTVQINGEEFTAGMISYTIGSRQELMEVGEA